MEQMKLLEVPRRQSMAFNPKEFKLLTLRECLSPQEMQLCDTPEKVPPYWREHVSSNPYFSRDVESFVVIMVNIRRRIIGHVLISTGTLDTILVHPREVFRPACIANAAAIILAHCHPSGDPMPSEADIKVTRDLIRAGQLMKIEVLDHVIIGTPGPDQRGWVSLRELGFCAV